MAPFLVQIIATVLARWFAQSWRNAVRVGLGVMFLFTAASHFSDLKNDLAAMIPPPFTGDLWVIYLTGVLQIAGAIGLMTPGMRRWAAWGLAAMLVGLFPANIYAAVNELSLGDSPVTSLWIRTPLQLFWIALLLQEAIVSMKSSRPHALTGSRHVERGLAAGRVRLMNRSARPSRKPRRCSGPRATNAQP